MKKRVDRVRAWLLVKAADPRGAQKRIAPLLKRDNRWIPNNDDVVIRADIVDCDFDLVVPVDVTGEESLKLVVGLIFKVEGVKSITIARVTEYLPSPPVEADCYIGKGETGGAYDKGPGRYPKSPGANPWG
jgi:hypothetical protein